MIVDKLVQTGYSYIDGSSSVTLTIPFSVNYIVIKLNNEGFYFTDGIKIVKGCTSKIHYASSSNYSSAPTVSYNSDNTLKISFGTRSGISANLWFEGYQYL